MYGMDVLMPRPPSSPNKHPLSRVRPQPKGTVVPEKAAFLISGSSIIGSGSLEDLPKTSKSKLRPHSAAVDKNIIKTLKRSPSVDNSFYDKFERLDRDGIEGDKVLKEKGGSVKSHRKKRNVPRRPSTSTSTKQKSVVEHIPERFLDLAIAYDRGSTEKFTKKNRIKSANLSHQERTTRSKKRPSTSHLSHERSISRKRGERSDSKNLSSAASGRRCSSRTGRNRKRRPRSRKSRSRTRRDTPRYNSYGSTSRQSPERKESHSRGRDRISSPDSVKINSDKKQNELLNPEDTKKDLCANITNTDSERKYSYVGTVKNRRVLSASVVKLRVDLKQLKDDGHPCVDAGLIRVSREKESRIRREVKRDTKTDTKGMSTSLDKAIQVDFKDEYIADMMTNIQEETKVTTNVPKLKMMVARTALPTFLKTLSFRSLTRPNFDRNIQI